jgi:hypothetical protein
MPIDDDGLIRLACLRRLDVIEGRRWGRSRPRDRDGGKDVRADEVGLRRPLAGGPVTCTDADGRGRQLKQVTPTTRRIRVVVHGVPLVPAQLSTDIPDKLVLGAGETDKDLAARLPTPDPGWIERILFPSALVDVTEAEGLGTTACTAEGLVTKRAK